jgi:exodeoxyribonuclease VII small subunit
LTAGRTWAIFTPFAISPADHSALSGLSYTMSSPAPSFETALTELESIVAAMDAGQMPLQESLNAYQRGVELLRHCQATLTAAEQQVQLLDDSGLRDFNPGGSAVDE